MLHELDFLSGGGEMGALIRTHDWSRSPLGSPTTWPDPLRMAVSICLSSRFPMVLWWGPDRIMLYNDAWRPVLGRTKHPGGLGRPAIESWPEIWDIIGPQMDVAERGDATYSEDLLLPLDRYDYLEEAYFTYSYSPIRNADGTVGGIFCAVYETTERVLGERRLRTLTRIADRTANAKSVESACAEFVASIEGESPDLPFALIYLLSDNGGTARLACSATISGDATLLPPEIDLSGGNDASHDPWSIMRAIRGGSAVVVDWSDPRLPELPGGVWPEPARQVVVLPFVKAGHHASVAGVLVAGVNPRRALDDSYRNFLGLVAGHLATAVANARAYEEERRRAEALAEIDRVKTAFFSNVSHEFRTPLTLMLGPLEDLLDRPAISVAPQDRALVSVAHRNGLRLLKLVNSLLDFSRIEAGRVRANFEPADLALLTEELASNFRAACERAGLSLEVDCRPVGEPVYVDREMWEKIVLNLLSNAFKFTFDGGIRVALRRREGAVELSVEDTGTGIPAQEIPRLFDRFHRVEGARGRTHEGTGIGLALVQELTRLHGGVVQVRSAVGQGSSFTVTVPLGAAHLPAGRQPAESRPKTPTSGASHFVEEALLWLRDAQDEQATAPFGEAALPPGLALADVAAASSARPQSVLVVDDNADVRDYVRRLLLPRYQVRTAANGEEALHALRESRPDLLLSDVMMPRLDGIGLLRAVRADPALGDLPVVLLSARAGEEASIEGLETGADDYLVKPFSARELIARVDANLKMARLRREAAEALRARTVELETVLETVPVAVWFTNDPEASRVQGNPEAGRLLRLGEHDNASLTAPAFEAPSHFRALRDGAEIVAQQLPMQRAARGEKVRGEELELRFDDGSSAALLVHALPVLDQEGGVVGAICAAMDISERRRAEDELLHLKETLEQRVEERTTELLSAQEQLRQAQKMEAIGQLTGGIAHDFNNMLSGVIGGVDVLRRRLATGRLNDVDRFLDAISTSARRAAGLTQRLLAFSRRQSLDSKAIDANALVREMLLLLRRTMGENITLELALDPALWPIEADVNQLESALLNLAINARDAMPGGGTLTIETANVTIDDRAAAARPGLRPGDHVMLAVRDTGQGMSPVVRERAFEPFFTTKPMGQGTGLGLSMIYGFVKQSDGYIHIDSEIGIGTTIKLFFSRSQAEVQDATEQDPGRPTRAREGETVLVVEDEATVRMLITEVLDDLGYAFAEAIDSETAVPILRSDRRLDLLVTDVGLPGLNGRQLAEIARQIRPGLKVLFVTGYAEAAARRQHFLEPGMELIAKPFAMEALGEKIRGLIGAR